MENQLDKAPKEIPVSKKKIALPIIALMLDILPFIVVWIMPFLSVSFMGYVWILIVLSPLAGLVVGVAALNQGKDVIGICGKVIAIIAISLPLLLIGFIIVFFVGATTGIISLM